MSSHDHNLLLFSSFKNIFFNQGFENSILKEFPGIAEPADVLNSNEFPHSAFGSEAGSDFNDPNNILFTELADGRFIGKASGDFETDAWGREAAYVDIPSICLNKNGLVIKYSSLLDPHGHQARLPLAQVFVRLAFSKETRGEKDAGKE